MKVDRHFVQHEVLTILFTLLFFAFGKYLNSKLVKARYQRAHFSSVVRKFLDASERGLANARDQFAGTRHASDADSRARNADWGLAIPMFERVQAADSIDELERLQPALKKLVPQLRMDASHDPMEKLAHEVGHVVAGQRRLWLLATELTRYTWAIFGCLCLCLAGLLVAVLEDYQPSKERFLGLFGPGIVLLFGALGAFTKRANMVFYVSGSLRRVEMDELPW